MPYIGRDLNRGNYLKLDDISSSFDSSTTTFNLTVGGSAFLPGSAFAILVSVGGVIQEPESAYQVNNSEITFANAPTAQDSFFCIALGVSLGIGVPGNGTVNGPQMAKPFNYDGFFYLDDANNRVGINSSAPKVALDVNGNANISGILTASSFSGSVVGNINNASGISTFYDLRVSNNLTVEGTTTTLDTNLIGVDRVEVGANSNTLAGIAVTQSGSADIVRLYDGASQVVTVDDVGNVGIGLTNPSTSLDVGGDITIAEKIIHAGDSNTFISFSGNDTISFDTAGTEKLQIDSGGQFIYYSVSTQAADFGTGAAGGAFHKYDLGSAGATIGYLGSANNLVTGGNVADFVLRSQGNMILAAGGGTERLRIKSNGALIKGNSGTQVSLGNGANTQLIGTAGADASLALVRQSQGGGEFYFAAGSSGTNIANNNGLGFIKFMGYHTNGYDEYARIQAYVDGTNGDGDAPGRLSFRTTPAGSATSVERLRIASDGTVDFYGNQTNTPSGIFGFRYDKSNDTDLSVENLDNGSVNNNAGIRLATNHSNIKFRYFNNGGFYISNASTSGYLHYYEGSDSRLYIDTNGNISINNSATPPTSNGQVGKRLGIKSTQNNIIIGETTNSGNSGLILESRVTGRSGNARCSQLDLGNGFIKFYTAASGADVTEKVRITSTGNVLIGKTANSGKGLEVYQAGDAAIRIQNNASGTGNNDGILLEIGSTSKDALIWNYESANMRFGTVGTERLRIDSSGHLHTGYISGFGGDHVNILATDGGGISIAQNNSGNATSGTVLGSLSIQGYLNGQTFSNAEAKISGIAAANHTGSSAATDMVFYTKSSLTGPGSAPDERLRITSAGKFIIGHTASLNEFHGPYGTITRSPQIQINGTNVTQASMSITSWDNNVVGYYGPALFLAKSGSSTIGTNARVSNLNSILGSIIFSGDDGTDFVKGAMIQAAVDASTGDNDMPGRLMFLTTPDTAQEPIERLRITSGGDLYAGNEDGYAIFDNSTVRPKFQFRQHTGDNRGFAIIETRGDGNGQDVFIAKSRGGNGTGIINAGDQLGKINFAGADGTNMVNGAQIFAYTQSTATVAANRMPTNLSFRTHDDDTSGLKERMRIFHDGRISISKNQWAGSDSSFGLTVHTGSTSETGPVPDGIMIVSQQNNGNQNSSTGKLMFCGHAQTNGPFMYGDNMQAYGKKDLVFHTRSTSNSYSTQLEETARFTYNGKVGINSTTPQQLLDVKGSINGGTEDKPFQRFHDGTGGQREAKHYFRVVKNTSQGNTTVFDLITIDVNQNFHQAICKVFYGSRLQAISDSTTNVSEIHFGINRFNGGGINFTRHVINQQSNPASHGDINLIQTVSGTQYRVRATFSSSVAGSSFMAGYVELIGVGNGDDGRFYSLSFENGLTK